jgi:hypothetical protein
MLNPITPQNCVGFARALYQVFESVGDAPSFYYEKHRLGFGLGAARRQQMIYRSIFEDAAALWVLVLNWY